MSPTNDIETIFRGVSSIHTYDTFEGVRSYFVSAYPTSAATDLRIFRGHGEKLIASS